MEPDDDDAPLDRLWTEYGKAFLDFDDLSLARWMAQTLGQLQGRIWRLSHPLLGAFRLAAQIGHERGLWLKRLVHHPAGYVEAPCCRAPLLPLFTRDLLESGIICQHCNATATPLEELPADLQSDMRAWAEDYAKVHDVAHWDDRQRKSVRNYDRAFEDAACASERLLAKAARHIVPRLLDLYPAAVWEDQDECLEVRPEDIEL